jgi:hypothetical protein
MLMPLSEVLVLDHDDRIVRQSASLWSRVFHRRLIIVDPR